MNNDDPIANALDIIPMPPKMDDITAIKNENEFITAKENILNLIDVSTSAFSELSELATMSQDTRVYRVMAEFLATLVAANKELVVLKQIDQEIQQKENSSKTPQTINQNLILSTKDLIDLIKEKQTTNE